MKTINTKELKERLEAGPVAIFDVRGDVAFDQGHIPSAKTAPLGSLVFRVARLMNPESFVVVYSANKDCGLAKEAVERLENLGLKNVHCYVDGLEDWHASGFPIVPSPDKKSHTHGEFEEVRPVVVDRENAYGGAFRDKPSNDMEGAGG